MIIHVVQPGDNIESIANAYSISVSRIILDNGIRNPYSLVPGQTIVIATPEIEHTVQMGDTLGSIANEYGTDLMHLLRNNPYLNGRATIYPGETLVIKYPIGRQILTNGFCYPYISTEILKKTLPSLTFLSVYNYKADKKGQVIAYDDDTAIIQLAKDYGVIPLMMIATLTRQGEPDLEVAYELLLNEEYVALYIQNTVSIIKEKGYYGINMVFSYITPSNQKLYENLTAKVSQALKEEGFIYYITINPDVSEVEEIPSIDFTVLESLTDGAIFTKFVWGSNSGPPAPVSSNYFTTEYIKHLLRYFPPHKLEAGIPIIGYEWVLPFIEGRTVAKTLTIEAAINIANEAQATIFFDEVSQTPYFLYYDVDFTNPTQHIVWFTDARSINALLNVITEHDLNGFSVWNIMIYYAQVWLVLNSQYEVIKLIPDNLND